jgi:transketolase
MARPEEDITEAFGEELVEVGKAVKDLVVLEADIADSCRTERFRSAFPGRSIDIGVAEQSLPTFAAGLALVGKIPVCNSFAAFSVHRGVDMIRQSVAYNRANVKIVGHSAGQSMGYTGPSHHTVEDIAVLRSIPGMTIICPCDGIEARKMLWWMVRHVGPVYLRLTRGSVPLVHSLDYEFELGKTERLREGRDASIFATGDMVHRAIAVREKLEEKGVQARVINVPTLKPLRPEAITVHGEDTRFGLTIEDHNIYGGLGSAVAEIYAEHLQKPLKRLGIQDTFTESDDAAALRDKYGLSVENALRAAAGMMTRESDPRP